MLFEAKQAFSGYYTNKTSGQKEATLPKTLSTGQALHWLFS